MFENEIIVIFQLVWLANFTSTTRYQTDNPNSFALLEQNIRRKKSSGAPSLAVSARNRPRDSNALKIHYRQHRRRLRPRHVFVISRKD